MKIVSFKQLEFLIKISLLPHWIHSSIYGSLAIAYHSLKIVLTKEINKPSNRLAQIPLFILLSDSSMASDIC